MQAIGFQIGGPKSATSSAASFHFIEPCPFVFKCASRIEPRRPPLVFFFLSLAPAQRSNATRLWIPSSGQAPVASPLTLACWELTSFTHSHLSYALSPPRQPLLPHFSSCRPWRRKPVLPPCFGKLAPGRCPSSSTPCRTHFS